MGPALCSQLAAIWLANLLPAPSVPNHDVLLALRSRTRDSDRSPRQGSQLQLFNNNTLG